MSFCKAPIGRLAIQGAPFRCSHAAVGAAAFNCEWGQGSNVGEFGAASRGCVATGENGLGAPSEKRWGTLSYSKATAEIEVWHRHKRVGLAERLCDASHVTLGRFCEVALRLC